MTDLAHRVLEAIGKTEQIARDVTGSIAPWEVDEEDGGFRVLDQDMEPQCWPRSGNHAAHIAHNDPSAVLRRCAADRKTVERCAAILAVKDWEYDDTPDLAREVLADRAAAYGLSDDQEAK